MKVANSLKTLKNRERNCQLVRRRGRVYVINKKNPRFKARQGWFFIFSLDYLNEDMTHKINPRFKARQG